MHVCLYGPLRRVKQHSTQLKYDKRPGPKVNRTNAYLTYNCDNFVAPAHSLKKDVPRWNSYKLKAFCLLGESAAGSVYSVLIPSFGGSRCVPAARY